MSNVPYRKDPDVRFDYLSGKWIEHRIFKNTTVPDIAIVIVDVMSDKCIENIHKHWNMLNKLKVSSPDGFAVCLLALKPNRRTIDSRKKRILMKLCHDKCYCFTKQHHSSSSTLYRLFSYLYDDCNRVISKHEIKKLAGKFSWRSVEIRDDPRHIRGLMRRPLHYMTSDVLFSRKLRNKLLASVKKV